MLYERHKIAFKPTLMVHDSAFAYADFVVDNLVPLGASTSRSRYPFDRGTTFASFPLRRRLILSDIPTKLIWRKRNFLDIFNFRYFYYYNILFFDSEFVLYIKDMQKVNIAQNLFCIFICYLQRIFNESSFLETTGSESTRESNSDIPVLSLLSIPR